MTACEARYDYYYCGLMATCLSWDARMRARVCVLPLFHFDNHDYTRLRSALLCTALQVLLRLG